MSKKITERCLYCGQEVELESIKFVAQECPNCGEHIKACSLCEPDNADCKACADNVTEKAVLEFEDAMTQLALDYGIPDEVTDKFCEKFRTALMTKEYKIHEC